MGFDSRVCSNLKTFDFVNLSDQVTVQESIYTRPGNLYETINKLSPIMDEGQKSAESY